LISISSVLFNAFRFSEFWLNLVHLRFPSRNVFIVIFTIYFVRSICHSLCFSVATIPCLFLFLIVYSYIFLFVLGHIHKTSIHFINMLLFKVA
jgi:hypothetical protein